MRMEIAKLGPSDKFSLADIIKSSGITYRFYTDKNDIKDLHINNLCADSRKAQPGDLFVAIPCPQVIRHTAEAIDKGARIVIATTEVIDAFHHHTELPQTSCLRNDESVIFIETPSPRLALSLLAKAFFKTQPEVLCAVTGTNGKSSIVSIVRQFWELLGYHATSFGTLGVELTKQALHKKATLPQMPSTLNTYDSLSFFYLLQSLAHAKINHAVFEASSHGLDQSRIHGCQLSVAGFTNLTQDHLDYHQTMEEYFQAKAKLFAEVLSAGKIAVLNADSPYTERLKEIAIKGSVKVLTYALHAAADLVASQIKTHGSNITFDLKYKETTYPDIVLNLSGTFQVENTLCAIGMLLASGTPLSEILPLIPKLKSVAGRMELIGSTPNGAHVYVDYAHTPDALERALKSLRTHTSNSIWVVFGCGGDRDNLKRPLMGKIALDLADSIVITDDNPRSENPANIRQQILKECISKAHEIADRRQAIAYAIAHLEKGDTLLIAGKGHEAGQIIENKIYPFSDKQEAEEVLARLKI
jgi:UDP-N-acetylmuramoyl-L-alanyl-D-glutamate--2,6-diaminopimelate ligase